MSKLKTAHGSQYARETDLKCPTCGAKAELKDSAVIYGRSYGLVWICPNFPACNCYVGCHNQGSKPKGTLADEVTRAWRKKAHMAFDVIWQTRLLKRGPAYARLAKHFGHEVHIGESDATKCAAIIDWARAEIRWIREGGDPATRQKPVFEAGCDPKKEAAGQADEADRQDGDRPQAGEKAQGEEGQD